MNLHNLRINSNRYFYFLSMMEENTRGLRSSDSHPDEDYIEQGIKYEGLNIDKPEEYNQNTSLEERTKSVRDNIESYKSQWIDSFNNLGNISHKGHIPSEAIKSVSIINAPISFYMNINSMITIQNALFTGNKYEFYTNLIFDKEYTLEEALLKMYIPMNAQEDIPESKKEELISMHKQTGQVEHVRELLNSDFWFVQQNSNYK